MAEDETSLVL